MIAFLIGSVSPWLRGRFRDAFGDVPGLSYGFAAFAGGSILAGAVWATGVWWAAGLDATCAALFALEATLKKAMAAWSCWAWLASSSAVVAVATEAAEVCRIP